MEGDGDSVARSHQGFIIQFETTILQSNEKTLHIQNLYAFNGFEKEKLNLKLPLK